ncbi:MAG: hypothetical protein JRI36_11335, partial [Deltaproteobacteria bacterium]|nr:hypothetical protein [Deltaproteobacteria bacterium]
MKAQTTEEDSKSASGIPTKEILEAAERLPPFPAVIWKVTSLLRRMA